LNIRQKRWFVQEESMKASLSPQPDVEKARIGFEQRFGSLQTRRYEAKVTRFDFNTLTAAAHFRPTVHQADYSKLA
jgi:hypothetical protein